MTKPFKDLTIVQFVKRYGNHNGCSIFYREEDELQAQKDLINEIASALIPLLEGATSSKDKMTPKRYYDNMRIIEDSIRSLQINWKAPTNMPTWQFNYCFSSLFDKFVQIMYRFEESTGE